MILANQNRRNYMSAPSGYSHFNYHMRDWMSILIQKGLSCREVAKIIGKHHTSVSREINRNSEVRYNKRIYVPFVAHQKYYSRLKNSKGYKLDRMKHLKTFIENKLEKSWSPEAISGYLKYKVGRGYVSHETIYRYIYLAHRDWICFLAHGLKRRRRRNRHQKRSKTLIPGRISIDKRPMRANERKQFGHFEVDTIVSKKTKESILVILERKTRLIKLRKIKNRTAEVVKDNLIGALQRYKPAVRSITYDNATENVLHQIVNVRLNCSSYFCNPYHSWEKGSIENVNGLIRRFIPKKRDLSTLTDEELRNIERIINSRPRKIFDFDTPRKLFDSEWCTYP